MPTAAFKKEDPCISVDSNLSDFWKSGYTVTKVENPEILEKLSKDPFVIASVERAKAFIAKYGLPKDQLSKKGK